MTGTNPPALPSFKYYPLPARERDHYSMGAFSWLVVTVLMLTGVASAFGNWTYFIGGRFTPLKRWTGYGKLHRPGEKDLAIYFTLWPDHSDNAARDSAAKPNLRGAATVCTTDGSRYDYQLEGLVSDAWLRTEGSHTGLKLVSLNQEPATRARHAQNFNLSGFWRNGSLVMDDNGSLLRWLQHHTPRSAHKSRRTGTGRSQVTISYGERPQFDDLCNSLTAHPSKETISPSGNLQKPDPRRHASGAPLSFQPAIPTGVPQSL